MTGSNRKNLVWSPEHLTPFYLLSFWNILECQLWTIKQMIILLLFNDINYNELGEINDWGNSLQEV
jgi:hypothetical protein